VAADEATSLHKPQSGSQLRDSGYVHSGIDSLMKVIKVGCLNPLQLILMFDVCTLLSKVHCNTVHFFVHNL